MNLGRKPNFFSLVLSASDADPYHFDTDPDPGCEKIRDPDRTLIRIGSRPKRILYQENLKI